MIIENTIQNASRVLKQNNIITHQIDAEILLSNIMGIEKEFLVCNSNINISNKILKKYDLAISRRINREPIAYIIGKKEFWSKDFVVNKATLVPRPETELLIYKIINYFKNKGINILDIGTGSGCVLLSILKELKLARGIGIDISSAAIKIANINAKKFNLLNQSKFKVYDLNNYNIGKYDLIISNPPYIPSKDIKNLSKDIINFEPKMALDGGIDGLDLIKKVIYKSNYLLKRSGLLAMEIGFGQYNSVSDILKHYKFREVSKVYDYKSNVRCIISTN
jgi:release factor glutamine methyltransferase